MRHGHNLEDVRLELMSEIRFLRKIEKNTQINKWIDGRFGWFGHARWKRLQGRIIEECQEICELRQRRRTQEEKREARHGIGNVV